MNADEVLNNLRGRSLEGQVTALNEATDFTVVVAEEALNALAASRSPVVIAEALFKHGVVVRTALERRFLAESSTELRSVFASLLVQLGSTVGVEHLIEIVKTSTGYENIAAISLAKAGVKAACPALIEKLEGLDHSFYANRANAPYIHTFVSALHRLGGVIPPKLRERLLSPDLPAEVRNFVR